jgi:hypothetical protein
LRKGGFEGVKNTKKQGFWSKFKPNTPFARCNALAFEQAHQAKPPPNGLLFTFLYKKLQKRLKKSCGDFLVILYFLAMYRGSFGAERSK